MDLQLAGKTVLITGGSKGIGKSAAEVLAEEGCNLILVARGAEMLNETAAEIRAKRQVNVRTIAADLSSDASVCKVAQEAGEIDVLVNNAGAIPPGDVLSVDDARWRQAWDLKVFGYISFCRVIYDQMKARKAGVIINVIGSAGEKFPTNYIAGAAGNASLMAFTRALGKGAPADLAPSEANARRTLPSRSPVPTVPPREISASLYPESRSFSCFPTRSSMSGSTR